MTGELPVAVLGAGPVGLAAAARLLELDVPHVVLESGDSAATHVRQWAHVRMFTSWKWNVDPVARRTLERRGWTPPPDDDFPTGGELWKRYLEPLSRALSSHIRFGHRVVSVGKLGFDRARSGERNDAPFEVRYVSPGGGASGSLRARAVVDATGTWSTPNPLGAGGYAAPGERELSESIRRRLPDVLGRDRDRFAGRSTLVVGSGDSAFTALSDLTRLADEEPRTRITWAFRGKVLPTTRRRVSPFPECVALMENVRRLVEAERIVVVPDFAVESLEASAPAVRIRGGGRALDGIDVILAATGFRPDHGLASELRLSLDPATDAVAGIAPLIERARGDCGTVRRHGVAELSHPDGRYFIVGIKSYGRAPSFLLDTGYQQTARVIESLGSRVTA